MAEIYLDATNAISGRLASHVAKQALLGKTIKIFNCEKAVITGKKASVFAKEEEDLRRGCPFHGPYPQRLPDRFLRRIIRGMLPYKQPKGKAAYHRILCYLGVPAEFEKNELSKLSSCDVLESNARTFQTIAKICKFLGGPQ